MTNRIDRAIDEANAAVDKVMRHTPCNHCDKTAEWEWNGYRICERCLSTIEPYCSTPLREFTTIAKNTARHTPGPWVVELARSFDSLPAEYSLRICAID